MSKLKLEALMTIETLAAKRMPHIHIACILGVTEGTARYRLKRMAAGAMMAGRGRNCGRAGWPLRSSIGAASAAMARSISRHCTNGW